MSCATPRRKPGELSCARKMGKSICACVTMASGLTGPPSVKKPKAGQVTDEANDGREVFDLIKEQQPDVVLMDVSMPNLNGLQALARITRDYPQVRVIMLSMHHNDEYVWQALKAGAAGYLLKKAATAELETALQRVVRGEIYLSREISSGFTKKFPLQQIAQ